VKRVLLVHQHFRIPEEGGGVRSYYLAKKLAENGIRVKVLAGTSPSRRIEYAEGPNLLVKYLKVSYSQEFSFYKRIYSYLNFAFGSVAKRGKGIEKPDLAYVISTPLSVGLTAIVLKKVYNIPYVFEVGDLWPDVPIQMGILKNPVLIALARKLEKLSYKNAEMITALSQDIKENIQKIVSNNSIIVIPNFADLLFFRDSRYNLSPQEDAFHLGYFGAAGKANGIPFLVELVKRSKEINSPIQFHFMVQGSEAKYLTRELKDYLNTDFYDYGSKIKVKEFLKKIDAGIVSYSNFPILGTGSPNKLFDLMAAGKIIICVVRGWFQEKIENANAGFYFSRGNPEDLFNNVSMLLKNRGKLVEMQKNSEQLGETEFAQEKLLQEWFQKLINLPILKG
jgi:glycosyltransferase involved in cell wall biosynthesis